MLAQAPTPFINPLRAAMSRMMSELNEGSPPKKPVVTKNGNWRTRQLMGELKKAKSFAEVISFEEEFRGVVYSQESRARVKLLHAFLHGQYLLDERQLVWEAEQQDRSALESMAFVVLGRAADLGTVIGHEMYYRHLVMQDFFTERYHQRNSRDAFYISIRESLCRQMLIEVESFERRETEQRRFLAVGREIDMELLRLQSERISFWAETTTSNFNRAVALLSAQEERDRISLERFFLLKLSLIANDEENEAARLVVFSVMRASLLRRRLQNYAQQRELAERVLAIPIKEADTRNLIEKVEMEKRQELRVCFFLSWRTAFKKAAVPSDGANIVEHLEVYERLCVFDQWRYGLNALDERHYHERRLIAKREEKFEELYGYVVENITALWNQEGEEFNALCKQHSDFEWSQLVLRATDVLQTEERYLRHGIVDLELRNMTAMLMQYRLRECEYAAGQQIELLTAAESYHRESLTHQFGAEKWECLFDALESEEVTSRGNMEALAGVKRAEILSAESAERGETADMIMIRARAVREEFLFMQKQRQQMCAAIATLAREEWTTRRRVELEQQRERRRAYAAVLSLAEVWNRHALRAEEESAALALQRWDTVHREETVRGLVLQTEAERRAFLVESVDYAHPFLRACEVEELEARMDIITLAEITARAMASSHGLDRPVAYCSEELRTRHAVMHFMSTQELLQVLELELVGAVEPLARRALAALEERGRLALQVARDEGIGRRRIEAIASAARGEVHALFDRLISRADQWRTRGAPREPLTLSGPEALLRYFHQLDSSAALRRRAERERTRLVFGNLFQNFYWTRDAIVVQEFIARESCANAFHRKQVPRSLTNTVPTQVILRFYSLSVLNTGVLGSLILKVWDSEDNSAVTCDLHEAQSISTAGGAFYVFFPTHQTEWIRPLAENGYVFYFEVRDSTGVLVATASYLLQKDAFATDATLLPIPIDGCMGRMNVVLYVR